VWRGSLDPRRPEPTQKLELIGAHWLYLLLAAAYDMQSIMCHLFIGRIERPLEPRGMSRQPLAS